MDALRRVLDSRYLTPATAPIRRTATVTAVDTTTATATVQVGGDTAVSGSSVPYVGTVQPAVNDVVLLDVIAGAPVIVASVLPRMQWGHVDVVFSAAASAETTVTWPVPYSASPEVIHSVQVASNLDILSNLKTLSATAGTFRLFQRGLGNVSGTATLHWQARGR